MTLPVIFLRSKSIGDIVNRTTKNALATIIASLFALGSTFAGGTAASAAQSQVNLPADTTPDRTIYVDHAAPPLPENAQVDPEQSTNRVKIRVGEINDLPLIPQDGETVRIVYTDAVSDVNRAGSCTKSLTTYTPYLSGGNVWVNAGWTVSTGCEQRDQVTVQLASSLIVLASSSFSGSNDGYATTGGTSKACKNSNTTKYVGIGRWGSGGSVWSPFTDLNCGV